MIAVAAHPSQVMSAELQPVGSQQPLHRLLVERGPLQLEEQQRGLDLGLALLHPLQQCTVGRVRCVGGEAQRSVGAGSADQVVHLRELLHGCAHTLAVELRELSSMALGEALGHAERRL